MSDLSPETRRLLNMARESDALPSGRRSHMKAKLFARIAAVPVFTTAAAAAANTATTLSFFGPIVKGLAGIVLVGSIGAGSYVAMRDASKGRAEVRLIAAAQPAAFVPVDVPTSDFQATAPLPAIAPKKQTASAALVTEVPRESRAKRAAPSGGSPQPASPQTGSARSAGRISVAQNTTAQGPVPLLPEPLVAPTATAVPTPVVESSLPEETRLLREADQALRAGNTERALTLLDEHATRFPDGVLEPERSAERVVAACKTGRGDAALVKQFLATHRGSPLGSRIQVACAGVLAKTK
jgi:hypothetical protein